jgi:hypothetical protein
MMLFEKIMPFVLQTGGDPRIPFYRLAEFYDWDGVDEMFSGLQQKSETLAVALAQFQKGQVKPEQLIEAASAQVLAALGPAKLKALVEKMQGGGGAGQPGGAPAGPTGSQGDPTPAKTAAGVL